MCIGVHWRRYITYLAFYYKQILQDVAAKLGEHSWSVPDGHVCSDDVQMSSAHRLERGLWTFFLIRIAPRRPPVVLLEVVNRCRLATTSRTQVKSCTVRGSMSAPAIARATACEKMPARRCRRRRLREQRHSGPHNAGWTTVS